MTRAEAARLGGLARAAKLSRRRRRAIARVAGSAGGKATLAKHGPDHLRELGRKGFAALVAGRYSGDKTATMAALHSKGWHRHLQRLTQGMGAEDWATTVSKVERDCEEYLRKYQESLAERDRLREMEAIPF
jgi:general stress protein YciG